MSEKREINMPSDHGGRLEQPLLLERKAINPRREHRLDGRGHLNAPGPAARGGMPPALPTRASVSTRLRTFSSRKKGLPSVRSIKICLKRSRAGSIPRRARNSSAARGGQWVDLQFGEVGADTTDGDTRGGS